MAVLVIVREDWEAHLLVRIGARLAGANEVPLLVYRLSGLDQNAGKKKKPESPEEVEAPDRETSAIFRAIDEVTQAALRSEGAAESSASPASVVLKGGKGRARECILQIIRERQVDYLIISKQEAAGGGVVEDSLPRQLFLRAPCATLLLRLEQGRDSGPRRILAPASGGPHAIEALRLAHAIASGEEGSSIVALFVEPDAGELASEVGQRILLRTIKKAGLEDAPEICTRVVLSNNVRRAIAQEAEEGGYDLMLVGASNTGTIRRTLFGTVPDRLLAGKAAMAIGVVRAKQPLTRRIQQWVERWLDLTVPQLNREDRVELFQTLQAGSEWNFDFLALITLSTALAGIGLIQNSTAVVIGAMLVAPLMTPILGAGLALVQGNAPLLRNAFRSIFYGFLSALCVSLLLGALIPLEGLTSELVARGAPTLLDLAVGFFSGLAAAHCVSRPNLSAALPGVAIAAALVPPIATVGISLAMGEFTNAEGAALLFSTNVIAIILGASLSLFAGGLRGREGGGLPRWVPGVYLGLMLSAVLLALPLGLTLLLRAQPGYQSQSIRNEAIATRLQSEFFEKRGMQLLRHRVLRGKGGAAEVLEIELETPRIPRRRFVQRMERAVAEITGGVKVPVRLIPRVVLASSAEVGRARSREGKRSNRPAPGRGN